jgi:hypothetical protein
MTHPVLFADAFRNMVATRQPDGSSVQNVSIVVEVGAHSALAGPIRQSLTAVEPLKGLSVAYGTCLERNKDAVLTLQNLAGFLVTRGCHVDTVSVNNSLSNRKDERLRVLPGLPSYPWNHSHRFWRESRISTEHRFRDHPHHDLLGVRLTGTSNQAPIWRQVIRAAEVCG